MKRTFIKHDGWTAATQDGCQALAYIAIQPRRENAVITYHAVETDRTFTRLSMAEKASERALENVRYIDDFDNPVFQEESPAP
ncbi:hypothetical protein D9M71_68810 [compost metagenome]